jgi:RHS repeat-associated protein
VRGVSPTGRLDDRLKHFLAKMPRPLMLSVLAKPRCIKASHRRRRRGASRVWLPGQYLDAESGLNYNVNRDYEPATGRYIQSDPIGLDGGPNTCAYVASNPFLFSDQLGFACDQEDRCYQQYEEDSAVCRSLPNVSSRDKEIRQACWASAADRLGACNAKRPIPRLVKSLSAPYAEPTPRPQQSPTPNRPVYVPPVVPLPMPMPAPAPVFEPIFAPIL